MAVAKENKLVRGKDLYYVGQRIKENFAAKEDGKGLSTNDYTTDEKTKLAGIESGAQKNVNPDWNAASGAAQILNKPSIPTKTSDLTNDSGFITSGDIPEGVKPATANPLMDGTAAIGSSAKYAKEDHVHPSDSSKADKSTTLAGYGITNAYTKAEVDTAISNKQDAIADLPAIRSGAALGSTSVQPVDIENMNYRPYDSENQNVMGYLVLKKNKTFAEQVTEENTIYEIRYDFDLKNATVTIPEGCVLKFVGGVITNGTLVGNGTRLESETPFINSAELSGSFYMVKDGVFDSDVFLDSSYDTRRISSLLSISNVSNKYVFKKNTYNDVERVPVAKDLDIDFSGSEINLKLDEYGIQSELFTMPFAQRGTTAYNFFRLKNCTINGDPDFDATGTIPFGPRRRTIALFNVAEIELENINIVNLQLGTTGTYSNELDLRYELSLVSLFYYKNANIKGVYVTNSKADNFIYAVPIVGENRIECSYCKIDTPRGTGLLLVLNGKAIIHDNYFTGFYSSALNLYGVYCSKIYNNVFYNEIIQDSVDGECIDFGNLNFIPYDVEVFGNIANSVRIFVYGTGYDINIHNNDVRESSIGISLQQMRQSDSANADFNVPTYPYEAKVSICNNHIEATAPTDITITQKRLFSSVMIANNYFKYLTDTNSSPLPLNGTISYLLNNIFDGYHYTPGSSTKRCAIAMNYDTVCPSKIYINGNKIHNYTPSGENYIFWVNASNLPSEAIITMNITNNALDPTSSDITNGLRTLANLDAYISGNKEIKNLSSNAEVAITRVTKSFPVGETTFSSANSKMIVWNGTAWVNMDGSALNP